MTAPAGEGEQAIRVVLHLRRPAAFGLPEETIPVRFTLGEGFARTPDQARRKILDLVDRGQEFSLEPRESPEPYRVRPEQVALVATSWADQP